MTAAFSVGKGALLPASEEASIAMKALQIGDLVDVDILRDRDSAFRRFVFAAINQVAKAADISPHQLRIDLLIKSGRYNHVTLPTGKTVLVVQSMKRQAMDDKELREFWVDARDLIVDMLPRLPQAARQDIAAMLKGGGQDGGYSEGQASGRGTRGDDASPRVPAPRRAAEDERGDRASRDRGDGGDP